MNARTVVGRAVACAALAAASLAAAACNSTGGSAPGGGPGAAANRAGQELVAGKVRLRDFDTSALATTGTVRYVLENTSGGPLDNLSSTVWFDYPGTGEGAIRKEIDSEPVFQDFQMARGESLEFAATSPRHGSGQRILGTRIEVEEAIPVTTVVGTRLLNGALECVALEGDLYAQPPWMWIELANVSGQKTPPLQIRATFRRSGETVAETPWQSLGNLAPGERHRFDFDFTGLPNVKGAQFQVTVRKRRI